MHLDVCLQELRVGSTLEVVGGNDAAVVTDARRVVLVGLARIPCLGEAWVGVGVRDHQHRTTGVGVQDRHLDLGATGVVRTHDSDLSLVGDVIAGVLGARGRVPRTGRSGRVVVRLQCDVVGTGLATRLLEEQRDCIVGVGGSILRCPLQRQVGGENQRACWRRSRSTCTTGCRCCCARAVVRVIAASNAYNCQRDKER
jgi:hypothetical protein